MKYPTMLAMLLAATACTDQPNEQSAMTPEAAAKSAAVARDTPLEITITQFPKAYFGRWGMTVNDCAWGASDAKGLLSIQGSLVKFYESTGTMRNGKRETLNSVSSDFEMVGEGQKWQTHVRYRLVDDRQQLIRQDAGDAQEYVYQRCPDPK
jgi:hypothetical protein